jgi:hypothetical protein
MYNVYQYYMWPNEHEHRKVERKEAEYKVNENTVVYLPSKQY